MIGSLYLHFFKDLNYSPINYLWNQPRSSSIPVSSKVGTSSLSRELFTGKVFIYGIRQYGPLIDSLHCNSLFSTESQVYFVIGGILSCDLFTSSNCCWCFHYTSMINHKVVFKITYITADCDESNICFDLWIIAVNVCKIYCCIKCVAH